MHYTGMTVTNTIRDDVIFEDLCGWTEVELTNDQILEKLEDEKKQAFLSFAFGVWVTAYARNNLLRNAALLDEYLVYADTDSLKLLPGYDKKVIDNYNKFVEEKIKYVSKRLEIPIERFKPKDSDGVEHMLGVFDDDGHYEEFVTQRS